MIHSPQLIMSRRHRILRHGLVVFIYVLFATGSLALSYLLRFEFAPQAEQLSQLFAVLPVFIAVKLITMLWKGQFESMLTFFSAPDFLRIAQAGAAAELICFAVWLASHGEMAPPRSIILTDGVFFVGLISAWRLYLRHEREQWESLSGSADRHQEPVAIVGAGEAGARLAQEFIRRSGLGMTPVVFWTMTPANGATPSRRARGGAPAWLLGPNAPPTLRRVIIAMPSAPRKRVRAIVEMLEGKGFRLDTIHSINDLLEGKTSLARLRPIQIDDLLGREPARLNCEGIRLMLAGRVVVVTGAGGSIGSELCRQILRHQPEKLLLVEQSEGCALHHRTGIDRGGLQEPDSAAGGRRLRSGAHRKIFDDHRPAILFMPPPTNTCR